MWNINGGLKRNLVCVQLVSCRLLVMFRHIYMFGYLYSLGVEPWTFKQRLGDAVFIPAGCPYQVRNFQVRISGRFSY